MIKRQKTADEAYASLSALCARCEYCISDMRRKMRAWTLTDGAEEEVISRLIQDGYINETRYAAAFASDKFRYNKWGWVRIQAELRRKGITDSDIDCARQQITDEETDEMLHGLLESKMRTIRGRHAYEVKARLFRFALSKGYSYEQAEQAIDALDLDD